MINYQRITAGISIAGISFIALWMAGHAAGARINSTKSLAVGLYWTISAPVKKGVYVSFCPPQNDIFDEARKRGYIGLGSCPGDYSYMMKQVAAEAGDTISIADDGVRVNGELLPFSAPRNADLGGRPLPRFKFDNYTLNNDELLLMTNVSATSFDSRYFGPIKRSQIKSVVRPIFTW